MNSAKNIPKTDTKDSMFVKPKKFDYHVITQDAKHWAPIIFKKVK